MAKILVLLATAVLLVPTVAAVLCGWVIMLAFGVLHASLPGVPAFGYLSTLLLTMAFSMLIAMLRVSVSAR